MQIYKMLKKNVPKNIICSSYVLKMFKLIVDQRSIQNLVLFSVVVLTNGVLPSAVQRN
jgi:hypothetical protein